MFIYHNSKFLQENYQGVSSEIFDIPLTFEEDQEFNKTVEEENEEASDETEISVQETQRSATISPGEDLFLAGADA